jgi:replication factor C subunit 1
MAKVTGAPSGKTSYVVVGENAGQSKLDKIKKTGTPTITEDEFLDLIATRTGVLDDKQKAAVAKADKKVMDDARELELREKEAEKLRKRKEAALEGTGLATKWVFTQAMF